VKAVMKPKGRSAVKAGHAQRNGRGQKSPAGRGVRATYFSFGGSASRPASRLPIILSHERVEWSKEGQVFLRGQTVKAGRGDEEVCVRAGCAFVLYPVSQNGVLLPAAGAPFTGARGRSGGFGEGPAKPETGGEGGIRTPDGLAPMPHFECGAFDHSATSPGDGRPLPARRTR
jgi:hypothetical protein